MNSDKTIVNKVAQSGLITLDLTKVIPATKREIFDLKDLLFKGLVLREKDFRGSLQDIEWDKYQNAVVGVYCSSDAIIPQWAYMLVAAHLTEIAQDVVFGDMIAVDTAIARKALSNISIEKYTDQRVILKGCGDERITAAAYLEASRLLLPVVKTLMYGEPCSTVPIYKKK